MDIFFCEKCGDRVTDSNLRKGQGVFDKNIVYCGNCVKEGHASHLQDDAEVEKPILGAVALDEVRDRLDTIKDDDSADAPAIELESISDEPEVVEEPESIDEPEAVEELELEELETVEEPEPTDEPKEDKEKTSLYKNKSSSAGLLDVSLDSKQASIDDTKDDLVDTSEHNALFDEGEEGEESTPEESTDKYTKEDQKAVEEKSQKLSEDEEIELKDVPALVSKEAKKEVPAAVAVVDKPKTSKKSKSTSKRQSKTSKKATPVKRKSEQLNRASQRTKTDATRRQSRKMEVSDTRSSRVSSAKRRKKQGVPLWIIIVFGGMIVVGIGGMIWAGMQDAPQQRYIKGNDSGDLKTKVYEIEGRANSAIAAMDLVALKKSKEEIIALMGWIETYEAERKEAGWNDEQIGVAIQKSGYLDLKGPTRLNVSQKISILEGQKKKK